METTQPLAQVAFIPIKSLNPSFSFPLPGCRWFLFSAGIWETSSVEIDGPDDNNMY